MAKFDKCILHIGTDKTGTKSLQQFFHKNRSVLAKKGILYPCSFGETHQFKLPLYVLNFNVLDSLKAKLGILPLHLSRVREGLTNKNQIRDFQKEITSSLQEEIDNTNCTTLLMSAEGLGNLFDVKEIQRLKEFLDNFVNEYTIIVYLRAQHEKAISGLSTRLSHGKTKENFFPLKYGRSFNYEKLLDRWSHVFGVNSVIPRIFSKNELIDSDIKKDFVSLMKWNWNDFEDMPRLNESLSADAQKFLLKINEFLPELHGNTLNEERGNIGYLVQENFIGKGMLPSRKESEKFFKMFENSNEKVRRKWFPEKEELFQVDFEKFPERTEIESGDFENKYTFAFEVFAKLWSEKQKEIHQLNGRPKAKKHLQEQIPLQQPKSAQIIFNREEYEKHIVSKNKYTFAFEVFSKLWSEKQKEIHQFKKKLKEY